VAFAAIWKDRRLDDFIVKQSDFYSSNFRCRVDALFTLRSGLQLRMLFLICGDGPNCCMWRFFAAIRVIRSTPETTMKNPFVIAGIFALTTALGSTAALAQSNSGGGGMSFSGSASGSASAQADAASAGRSFASAQPVHGKSSIKANADGRRSLARADVAAGTHGLKGRNTARIHGANTTGFCPPGQAKKPGLGSRFQC
jgi:hypothetical protein